VSDDKGKIIHVRFGPGGGRIQEPQTIEPVLLAAADEAVTDLFTKRDVAKLLGLSEARLRTLDRANIVSPSGVRNGRRAYTFQDLIALRATLMLAKNVKLRDVARAIGALRATLPRVARPLEQLRLVSDGRKVVVRSSEGSYEAVSGQMVMDFEQVTLEKLREDVVRVLRPDVADQRTRSAYDLYAKASALDEDPKTQPEAERLYKQAIELDPQLAIAYTNLGNILFRRGDIPGAEKLYRKAIDVDDKQPEAHYNLGYVMLDRGQPRVAAAHFERAIARDPRFADAHFNLAMAYEQIAEREKARAHWKKYLELEPKGTWAEIARKHLHS
jgi:tetratricopeptide (TPR) repeat protein